ncbi:transcriptional regulator [Actinoplanes sp. NBRC 14428]|uniref:Transcriptional regulator with XRE-family HTH domain n=1 Tax=Pseudosporangium ferrugineum TaxID=439699 RepID=A0A2T0RIN7_9ACTN|nr:helix-turn-helix transcriptional regulator [Pseudosporangium ferrugineum]PRY21018.1 transcriptional regulator with XRE-family HTH domain [Pseudosporangium ferrugineum]BCJ51896.1 transcriptional regulator [Actinoplanes sp. NBRC 14428]
MDNANPLGDYLRARRQLVSPEDVGLRATGLRRVAGLRREEVATLAGISADYYLRLEQGRDRHPSEQVLEALARVLHLDESATDYLLSLSRPRARARSRPRRERVPVGIRQLIEVIGLPAFVEGRYFDVLAANAMARALSPALRVGENRLRSVFLDPAERELYPDWERALAGMVAVFRSSVGTTTDDPRYAQLVGELSVGSEHFRRLWARHDVKIREGAPTRLRHPEVGEMTLRREKLGVGGSDGLLLVVYHAEPGTDSARSLGLLGSLAASESVGELKHEPGQDQPGTRAETRPGPGRGGR